MTKVGDAPYALFNVSVQGSSHIKREKEAASSGSTRAFPCQDCSAAEVVACDDGTQAAFLCVCDGHGGAAYFRSRVGAQMAIDVLRGILRRRMKDIASLASSGDFAKIETQLKMAIPRRWGDEVDNALLSVPITEDELSFLRAADAAAADGYLSQRMMLSELRSKDGLEALRADSPATAAKCNEALSVLRAVYGCTMAAFVSFPAGGKDVWLALQIGDGDCAVSIDGKAFGFPVPNDERCFLNQTTSLCDTDAAAEFRFAHGEGVPSAVMCMSDGIANCFTDSDDKNGLKGFCASIVLTATSGEFDRCKAIAECPGGDVCRLECREELAREEVKMYLPTMSARGSGDDLSVAMMCVLQQGAADGVRSYSLAMEKKAAGDEKAYEAEICRAASLGFQDARPDACMVRGEQFLRLGNYNMARKAFELALRGGRIEADKRLQEIDRLQGL